MVFALTKQDVEQIPLICHYTGKPLTLEANHFNTISIERLDSSKGYTKENVVFCCETINRMKQELSYDDFIETCHTIYTYAKKNRK